MSKPPRLLSGTTSILLDSMMTLWSHLGDGAIPRQAEIWKLIYSFLNVSLGYQLCQKPPKLLSGTTSILQDSMMTLWRHLGDGAIPRQVEIWKLIYSFLNVSLGHPLCQKPPRLLSRTTSVLLDSKDDTWMTLWRTQELYNFPWRYRSEYWYVASLMYIKDIHYVKCHQDSSQEPPASY